MLYDSALDCTEVENLILFNTLLQSTEGFVDTKVIRGLNLMATLISNISKDSAQNPI